MNATPRTVGSKFVTILLGLFLFKLLLYATLVPPWQIPDEPTHFEYAYLLYLEKNPLATVEPDVELQEQILQSMERFRFRTYLPFMEPEITATSFREDSFLGLAPSQIHRSPPLYYMLGSLWLRLFSPATLLEALFLLRLFSIVLTVAFMMILCLLVRWAFPDHAGLQVGAIAFAVFLPQLSFIGVGVNSDNAVNLFYAATMATGVLAATTKRLIWITFLAISVAASVLSKKTGLAAIPLAAFSLLLGYGWNRRRFSQGLLLSAVVSATLLLTHIFITWYAVETSRMIVKNVHYVWRQLRETQSLGAGQPLAVTGSLLLESFWGRFGWLTVRLSNGFYWSTWVFNILIATGAATLLARKGVASSDERSKVTRAMVTLAGLLILFAVFIRNLGDFQPQGRYLFPALPAFAIWFAAGISLMPRRSRPWIVAALMAWLSFFDLAAFLRYALPAFYTQIPTP